VSNFAVGQPGYIPPPQKRDDAASADRAEAFQAQLRKKELDKKDLQKATSAKAEATGTASKQEAARQAHAQESRSFADELRERFEAKSPKEEKGKVPGEKEGKEGDGTEGAGEGGDGGELKGAGAKGEAKGGAIAGGGGGGKKGEMAMGAAGAGTPQAGKEAQGKEVASKEVASKEVASRAATQDTKAAKTEKSDRSEKTDKKERSEKSDKQAEASGAKPGASLDAKAKAGKGDSFGGEGGGKPGSTSKEDLQKALQQGLASQMGQPHPFVLQGPTQVAPAEPVHKVQIPTEVVDKIVAQARFGLNAEGAHEFQIDLKHDVFKGLKLSITTKDGKVSIKMTAENADVQKNFESKANDLASALAAKGLNVTGVSVEVAGQRDAAQGESKGKQQADPGAIGGVRRGAPGARATPGLDSGPRTSKDYTA
jgi:hypothetical protein